MKESYETYQYKMVRRVAMITISINVVLTILKLVAGVYAHSTAMLADAFHSASDIITSAGVVIGVYISKKPRDKKHPFGHGKAESITGFLLSLILLFVGVEIGYKGIINIVRGNYQQPEFFAIWAAIISIILKEIQYQITIKVGKKLNSNSVIADAWHHRSDAFSSLGVLIGIIGARMGLLFLDPLVAILIAFVIIKISVDLLGKALAELMDTSLTDESLDAISNIILKTPYVLYIKDIKSRKDNNYVFINVSIGVDPKHSVQHSHEIAHDVERNIQEQFEYSAEVHVHVEPYNPKKLCRYSNT